MQDPKFWQDVFYRIEECIEPCVPGLIINLTPPRFEDIAEVYHELLEHEYNVLVVKFIDGRFAAIRYSRSYTSGCWDRVSAKLGTTIEQITRFGLTPYERQYFKVGLCDT